MKESLKNLEEFTSGVPAETAKTIELLLKLRRTYSEVQLAKEDLYSNIISNEVLESMTEYIRKSYNIELLALLTLCLIKTNNEELLCENLNITLEQRVLNRISSQSPQRILEFKHYRLLTRLLLNTENSDDHVYALKKFKKYGRDTKFTFSLLVILLARESNKSAIAVFSQVIRLPEKPKFNNMQVYLLASSRQLSSLKALQKQYF